PPVGERVARRHHAAAGIAELLLEQLAQTAAEVVACRVAVADLQDGDALDLAGAQLLERALEARQRLGASGLRQVGPGTRIRRDAAGHRQQDGAKNRQAETKQRTWKHAYFWLVMSWKDGDIAFSLAKAASEIMSYPASLKCTPSV